METFDQMANAFYRILGQQAEYPHPVHPAMVHMPIGLIAGAFIFLVIVLLFWGFYARSVRLVLFARAAYIMAGLAFLFWFITVFFGFMDWRHWFGGAWLFPFKVKMGLAGALFFLLIMILVLGRGGEDRWKITLPFYTLAVLAIVGLGYYGGQLTYMGRTPKAPEAYKAGEWQYHQHCATCHPDGGNTIQTNKLLIRSPLTGDFKIFEGWIRNPAPPMPAFSEAIITQQDAHDLYQYINNVINTLR